MGRGGTGPHRGPGGRRARRGDVRAAIITLLGERPMHGYEMIQELEQRTGGRWKPSAGSIYPTLQLLEDEGLVRAEEVDGRRTFSLTAAGTQAHDQRSEQKQPWEEGDEDSAHHQLRRASFQVIGATRQIGAAGSEEQVAKAAEVLAETRKRLYTILAED